jgi:O-antigen/teichoic acid export membrane protein
LDLTTAAGRGSERYRRATLTTLTALGARGVSVVTVLVSVPLTVHYLGSERYGLWITLSSIAAVLGFADLGIGNGLVNAIAGAHGRDDPELAKRYVSSAFFVLVLVVAALGVLFVPLYAAIPWPSAFNVSSHRAVAEAGPATAVFVGCMLVGVPLELVNRVQAGYQEGFMSNVWIGLGGVLGLAGVLVAIQLKLGLPWLVGAMTGGPVIAAALNSLFFFGRQRPSLRPHIRDAHWHAARGILGIGSLFLILQLASAAAYQLDSVIVAQVLGPRQVTQFAVPMRLFMLAPLLLTLVVTPLWPAYGEAVVRGDGKWLTRTLRNTVALSVAVSLAVSVVLVVFGRPLVHAWVGSTVTPSLLLLSALGVWAVISSVNGPLAVFLNGVNALRFQAVCAVVMVVANVALSIALTEHIGVSGVIWGSVIAQVMFVLVPIAIFLRRTLPTLGASAD